MSGTAAEMRNRVDELQKSYLTGAEI
jgi:hypothetical protein